MLHQFRLKQISLGEGIPDTIVAACSVAEACSHRSCARGFSDDTRKMCISRLKVEILKIKYAAELRARANERRLICEVLSTTDRHADDAHQRGLPST